MTDDIGATAGAWFDLVRRARLPVPLKFAALAVGSYADASGTDIYCGDARLALDLNCGYSTARRHLARLREIGLIERTKRVRKAGLSDEYRLVIGPDVLEHINVPSPSEYKSMANKIKEDNRRGRTRQRLRTARLDERYTDPYRSSDDGVPLTPDAVSSGDRDTTSHISPTRKDLTSNTSADLETAVTVRAREGLDEDPDFSAMDGPEPVAIVSRCGRRECRAGHITLGINRVRCHICYPRSTVQPSTAASAA